MSTRLDQPGTRPGSTSEDRPLRNSWWPWVLVALAIVAAIWWASAATQHNGQSGMNSPSSSSSGYGSGPYGTGGTTTPGTSSSNTNTGLGTSSGAGAGTAGSGTMPGGTSGTGAGY
jgi:hypothetical protein